MLYGFATMKNGWSAPYRSVDDPIHRYGPAGVALAVLLAGAPALAQRVDAPFSGNAVPQGSPLPRILPSNPPAVAPAAPGLTAPAAPGATPNVAVPIRGVVVEGATVFPQAQLAPLTAGLTGNQVALSRIEAARAAILSLYRGSGYVLTTVSATVSPNSVLRFVVIEGRIADVKLEGDIGPAGVQVLRFLRHLTEERPISNATLERWVLLAQDVPGVTLRTVLRPSADDPGALTLVAQVERQTLNGLLTVDNRAFRLTGPVEGLAVLDINSLTQFGEKTELSIYHTDGNTQNFGQASSEFFVGGSGLRIRLFAGYGEAYPSDFLRTIKYEGLTTTFGVTGIYPVIRQRQQTLNVIGSIEGVETEVRSASGSEGRVERTSRDSLRIGRLGAEYAFEDLWLGGDRSAVNFAAAKLSQGLPFLGGSGNDNKLPGRQGERVDFFKFSFELSRTQTLFAPWEGATVALRARLLGQATPDVLPPAEKFFLGGSEINRGFYSGEVTGDNALSGSLELQLNTGLDFSVLSHPVSVGAQFYAFYDRGQTWENSGKDSSGQALDPNARLSSEGIGARVNVTRYTEFDVEGVIRNTRLPSGTTGIVSPLKADAAYWRVLTRF